MLLFNKIHTWSSALIMRTQCPFLLHKSSQCWDEILWWSFKELSSLFCTCVFPQRSLWDKSLWCCAETTAEKFGHPLPPTYAHPAGAGQLPWVPRLPRSLRCSDSPVFDISCTLCTSLGPCWCFWSSVFAEPTLSFQRRTLSLSQFQLKVRECRLMYVD